jgi:intraflagellar transport protein 81
MINISKSKKLIHESMYFLLYDTETHKKRAYLAPFLESVAVPAEFMHDERVEQLSGQLAELQDQFKETHRYVEGLKQPGAVFNPHVF